MIKRVALVLSSGGARGYAHIGAIEELEARGYVITSVAGSSMGALIGGMYAAGGLDEVTRLFEKVDLRMEFNMTDLSLSLNHIVKGEKVMRELKKYVPDVNIEDLPISYRAIASDIKNYRETVIAEGSLYQAIRASISIPSLFKPVRMLGGVMIDGGVVNALPLNRVRRVDGDMLVAVNVSAPSSIRLDIMKKKIEEARRKDASLSTLKDIGAKAMLSRLIAIPPAESNYFTLLSKSFAMMIQRNTSLMIQLCPPDVLVDIPMNRFGAFDYDKADNIIRHGRKAMKKALEEYETSQKQKY